MLALDVVAVPRGGSPTLVSVVGAGLPSGSMPASGTAMSIGTPGVVVAVRGGGSGIWLAPTLAVPPTVTGAIDRAPMPSPTWPSELSPQHDTVVSSSTAQVLSRPAATSWIQGLGRLTSGAFSTTRPILVLLPPAPTW